MKILYALIALFFTAKTVFAQDNNPYEKRTFPAYSYFVSKAFDITCKMPAQFYDLKYMEPWKVREEGRAGMFYCPIIQSKNKDCVLMYCYSPFYISEKDILFSRKLVQVNRVLQNDTSSTKLKVSTNDTQARGQILFELETAFGMSDKYGVKKEGAIININEHVISFPRREAREWFNADSVFSYNLPLEKAFKKKYIYCTSMIICRNERPTMYFKWLFTKKGKQNEEMYIKQLMGNVWYNDGKWAFDEHIYAKELNSFFYDPGK